MDIKSIHVVIIMIIYFIFTWWNLFDIQRDIQKGVDKLRQEIHKLKEDAPAVDAVPVVRCKDCKFGDLDMLSGCVFCGDIARREDYFCADGERKKDE